MIRKKYQWICYVLGVILASAILYRHNVGMEQVLEQLLEQGIDTLDSQNYFAERKVYHALIILSEMFFQLSIFGVIIEIWKKINRDDQNRKYIVQTVFLVLLGAMIDFFVLYRPFERYLTNIGIENPIVLGFWIPIILPALMGIGAGLIFAKKTEFNKKVCFEIIKLYGILFIIPAVIVFILESGLNHLNLYNIMDVLLTEITFFLLLVSFSVAGFVSFLGILAFVKVLQLKGTK